MAFEIVDGMTGTKHISSDDLSALNIATIGKADCVLNYGDNFKLKMASANRATLGTGVGMVGGKRFWNQAATSLTVQSGTQGQNRNDLVVARYAKTSAGIESITPVVIKGTPTTGTAADPKVTANDLKLWRVPLDGISVGEPVKLFEPVASLATIGDSVSFNQLFSGTLQQGTSINVQNITNYSLFNVVCSNADDNWWPAICINSYNESKNIYAYGYLRVGTTYCVRVQAELIISSNNSTLKYNSGGFQIIQDTGDVSSVQPMRIRAIYGIL